jgi:hypothetical protein
MKILEKKFVSHGFNFEQIFREDDLAVYKKWKEGQMSKDSFEAIKIKSHNGYTIAGNFCPPSEMYPSNESWGVLGFTCLTREAAYARIDKMKEWDDAAPLPEQGKRGRGRPKGSKNKS